MTRETKVGLVVAGSFLCLVGVVVASRMGRHADPNHTSSQVAQVVTPKHDAEPGPKDPNSKPKFPDNNNASGVAQAEFQLPGATPPALPKPMVADPLFSAPAVAPE